MAGRRGIDIEGNAVVLWSPTVDSATAAGLASTRTYPLRSSFTPSYNMSINLIARFGRERARTSLESSFAQFQADRAVVGLVKQIRKNDLAAAEQLGQAIIEFDPDATVETVIINEGQDVAEDSVNAAVEEVTPESEQSDETKQ